MNEIVDKMIEIVTNYSTETTFRLSDLVHEAIGTGELPESNEMFDITGEFFKQCEAKNIQLENTQPGEMLGMPWFFTFIKK